MALVRYSDKYWFSDGTLAINTPGRIFPEHSNTLAPIFTDITGATPLPNPLNTDGAGFLTFWAEEGKYWVHMDSESFLVDVGLSEEEADLTTGTASGGEMNISLTPKAVDILPFVGYVVDNNDLLSVSPTVIKVDRPFQTVVLDGPAQTRSITWWLCDSAGTIIQQANMPSPAQRRQYITLGVSLYDTGLGVLVEVQTQPVILGQPGNQLADLMDAMGPLNLSGNFLSPAGATLSFNKTVGTMFSRGSHHFNGGVLTDDPHTSTMPAQTPATIRRILRTSTIPTPPPVLTVDPTQYDSGGVLVPVGGSPDTSTIQRVWLFATNTATAQIAVQYGQQTYSNLINARTAIGTENFVQAPITTSGALIGYIVATRVATDLSDPTQAVFVRAGKFSNP